MLAALDEANRLQILEALGGGVGLDLSRGFLLPEGLLLLLGGPPLSNLQVLIHIQI